MRKYIRLLLALAFVLAVTAPPPPAQAAEWRGEIYWYSDECYTNLVGYFARYCDYSTSQWGQQGPWGRHYNFDCPPITIE